MTKSEPVVDSVEFVVDFVEFVVDFVESVDDSFVVIVEDGKRVFAKFVEPMCSGVGLY